MKLCVRIKKKLDNITLDVDETVECGVWALLGASGAGKSMLLKCIAGIETPDEGYISLGDTVFFDSAKGINLPANKRRVGYMFQEYALYPHMTVFENVNIVARDRSVSLKLLEQFRCLGIGDRYPHEISGGQKQRVALARMVAASPKLVLLDEPFSALDKHLKEDIIEVTKEAVGDLGVVAVLVTHNYDELYSMADSVSCIEAGAVGRRAEVNEFFLQPLTTTEARLSGIRNICYVDETGYIDTYDITLGQRLSSGYIALRETDFTINKTTDALKLNVCELDIYEEPFCYRLHIKCGENASERLYVSLDKNVYSLEELKKLSEIYIPIDRIHCVTGSE